LIIIFSSNIPLRKCISHACIRETPHLNQHASVERRPYSRDSAA
jgi:hypothetical protein